MMSLSLKIDVSKACSPEFERQICWAVESGLLTEWEAIDVMADEIVENITVVEE